ncbi:MAG: hypothetical protein L6R38_008495 [Xanthoria sp. 2 TBL-2021]|nr:MAG: hypothetical protein L6R38_008495 [Xanthoria sp. 2 TBL-2021]
MSPFISDQVPSDDRDESQNARDAEWEKLLASIPLSLKLTLPTTSPFKENEEAKNAHGSDIKSAETPTTSSKDDTRNPPRKQKTFKHRMRRLLSTATVRPFCGDPRLLSSAHRRRQVLLRTSPDGTPKERLALLTLQYQFMQFDTICMRARVETMEIVVKIYRARVIHQYGLCSFHEHIVKEKHIAEIKKQKGKIRKLARSQQILQSQHFDQHADKSKEKRDAIASTYIPHSSSSTRSAKHEEQALNNFEQCMESAPGFSALVSETGMPCTSSSSSSTSSPEDKEKKLNAFKRFLESTTHYSTLKVTHDNRSRHAIRREQKLLHEGFKLENMLAYEDDLAHDFFNAVRLRDRARERLRDLKTMANFMIEQCVARFKYLQLYEKVVKNLERAGDKGKNVENDRGESDATVKRGTELDQLVASFDLRNMRMLMNFWIETLDLAKTDKQLLIRLVVFEKVRWKFSPPGEAEIPFEARVARLREILEMVRSEGRGGAGVRPVAVSPHPFRRSGRRRRPTTSPRTTAEVR